MSLSKLLVPLAIGALFLAFAASLPIVLWSEAGYTITSSDQVNFLILVVGFGVALAISAWQMVRVLRQYIQDLHDVSAEEAAGLVAHLTFGAGVLAGAPVLRVQAGQADLDGPPIVHKIGGPAKLNVELNNVVVTSRLGMLHRILGPGMHDLESFERVWSVVDLRPQRRTLTVEFVTRDGIPALCQSTLVCRIAPPGYAESPLAKDGTLSPTVGVARDRLFGYSEEAVFYVTTSQCVRKPEGRGRVVDWVSGMASDVLEATVRDVLEQHRLDELLNPQYWLEGDEGPPRAAATPKLVSDLEDEIESAVRSKGKERGVIVERVELATVRPAEDAISRQWLEFWQAKLQKGVDRYAMEAETTHEQLAEAARFEAQVTFVNRVLEEVQSLRNDGLFVPPQLIIASFMEVLHAMGDRSPKAQQELYEEAENLIRAVNAVQQEDVTQAEVRDKQLPGSPEKTEA